MYSRAQLSRNVAPVVALCSTAVAAGAGACEFRAAVDHNKHAGHNALAQSRVRVEVPMTSLMAWARLSADDREVSRCTGEIDRAAFEALRAASAPKVRRDPWSAAPIEQIRKVE